MRKRQTGVVETWLNQTKSSKKVGSMFFEGDTIYSYGKHFPIARLYQHAVLYNHEEYSATTASHQAVVRRYVHERRMKLFSVGGLVTENPSGKHVAVYQSEIDQLDRHLRRCRCNLKWKLAWIKSWYDEAVGFRRCFNLEDYPIRMPSDMPEFFQRSIRFRLGGIAATNKLLKEWELPATVDWAIIESILQAKEPLAIAAQMVAYREQLKGQTNE